MVIFIVFSILLPFFTNFSPLEKFWMPNTVFIDHPIVQFNGNFLIELTNSESETIRFSPSQLIQDNTILSSSSFETQDYSNKDIINVIKYRGHIQFNNPATIKDIKFFIFFDYYMTEVVNIHLSSNAHLFYSSNDGFSKIISDNELILKQNRAMTETYFMQEEDTNFDLDTEIEKLSNSPFQNDDVNYFALKNNYNFVYKQKNTHSLDLDITINIPYYQEIIIKLPNYTNIKNRWVLYSFLFFPTLFVCYCLMEMFINNGIFKTRIKSDIPIKM